MPPLESFRGEQSWREYCPVWHLDKQTAERIAAHLRALRLPAGRGDVAALRARYNLVDERGPADAVDRDWPMPLVSLANVVLAERGRATELRDEIDGLEFSLGRPVLTDEDEATARVMLRERLARSQEALDQFEARKAKQGR